MPIEIAARGLDLRFLAPNASALGIDDPERVTPDPVELWVGFIGRGFADRSALITDRPRVQMLSRKFEDQREEQSWLLAAVNLDPGLLRILSNVLLAAGIGDFEVRSSAQEVGTVVYSPAAMAALSYPRNAPPSTVNWLYNPPDEDDIVRSRTLHIELSEPFDAALMARLRDDLDVWTEVTCRSGFCPADEHPTNSGALPTFAYALDPQTIAVDFEGPFLVDEACFDSIASYLNRLLAEGIRIRSAEIG